MDAGEGAAVDRDGRVEDAAVRHHDPDGPALLGAGGVLRGLRLGGLLFGLLCGVGGLRLLLLRLLLGLRFDLLLLLLHLSRRRLAIVIVIAAAHQRQTGRAHAGSRAGAQQAASRESVTAHPLPIVPLAHIDLFLLASAHRRRCFARR